MAAEQGITRRDDNYSTWYLEAHEIVNDEVQGEALLVSW